MADSSPGPSESALMSNRVSKPFVNFEAEGPKVMDCLQISMVPGLRRPPLGPQSVVLSVTLVAGGWSEA